MKSAINALLEPAKSKTREVASVVGLIVSSFPGVRYGPLYYRTPENEKTDMLKTSGGNLDNYMFLSEQAVTDLHWLENVHKDPNPIFLPPSQLTLSVTAHCQAGVLSLRAPPSLQMLDGH